MLYKYLYQKQEGHLMPKHYIYIKIKNICSSDSKSFASDSNNVFNINQKTNSITV